MTVLEKKSSPSHSECYHRVDCRICLSTNVDKILNIPKTPIGDNYTDKADSVCNSYPLDLYLCVDCGHIQLLDVVNPELMYRNYIYCTSNSLGLADHFTQYVKDVVMACGVQPNSFCVDIGCNDGTLLAALKENGLNPLGVEPATRLAELNNKRGLRTIPEFL